jgi:hypothetical protein
VWLKTVTFETAAKKCFVVLPRSGFLNAAWVLLRKAAETNALAVTVITGTYWVLKLMMGLGSPVEASVTFLLKEYFPVI